MEKSKVIDLLKKETIDVEFVKKDGTKRAMTCTLREDILPKQIDLEEHVQKKTPNPEILAVFDVVNQGWRAFRWDSLKMVNGEAFV
jgi:hypothetical protein